MAFDTSGTPYLDRFKPEKNRTMVLFNPDRPLQQSELIETQSIFSYYLGSMGNSIFSDGNLQSGMDFRLVGKQLTVKDGLVYLEGKVRRFEEQTVTITGTGKENVGVKLVSKVITHLDDPTLLDQTAGVVSAFSPGADRLQETVVLTVDDPNAATVYLFENGQLFINTENPEMDKINSILAERTYDESGSYRVSGFNMWTEPHPTDPNNKIQAVIDTGRAYVLGYKVDKPTPTRLALDKAKEIQAISNEGFYYKNADRKGKLGNAPVSAVNRVTAQVRVTKEQVSRGVTGGGTDSLANTSVTKVERVWTEGAGAKEYVQATDYQLVNAQAISWAPAGAEPPAGGTYFVTYVYNKTLILGTDYKVTVEGEGDNREWYIDFNGLSGNKPVDESLVNVDYDFYLARKDLIVLDRNGNMMVHKGQPNLLRNVEAPNHIDPLTLQIGTVLVYPDSDTTNCQAFTITRLSMEDLQKLKIRVDNIEYNEAVNALDNPAMAGENPIFLRGVFSDGFISLDKYDVSHPDSRIAFSFEDAEITLPYAEVNKVVPQILENASEAKVWGRLVSAPFTEEKTISQPFATETMNVNPYNMFNKQGILNLNPSADNWIEEDRITITQEETYTYTAHRWWLHGGTYNSDLDRWYSQNTKWDDAVEKHNTAQGESMTGQTLSAGGTQTVESMIEYMRQINIEFTAENLHPNANDLTLTFDGVQVAITPASGYRKGSVSGSIMANADGTAKGTFGIPAGVRCGVREVTLRNLENTASNSFTAQGRKKTVQDIIIKTRVTAILIDPLAQSFQFETNKVISSFGLYFASKSNTDNVIVQVRGMSDGGQPNKTIYAETVLKPAQVKVSADSSAETKVTFDDPIMCTAGQEYCIVIITDSDQYEMWIATRSKPRIDKPNEKVNGNPYLVGVLYSSSNASAWTAHQDSDLKFNVYTAKFHETAILEFDTMKNVKVDRIVLMSTYLTPQNTGCKWDMKIVMENEPANVTVAMKEWQPISNYVDLDVQQLAREVKLRATFKANQYISPLLSLDDIMFAGFLTALKGSYVSRTIDLTDAPYNTIKVSIETFTPANTTVTPQFSTDEGKTWQAFVSPPKATTANENFTKLEYNEKIKTGTGTAKTFKVRLDMKTQNSFLRPRARRLMCLMKNE